MSDPQERLVALQVKSQLDSLVVSIELTLVSIVQGTALGALVNTAQGPLQRLDWHVWPALLTSLFFILIFWSRAVVHTLGFIRWPLDFVHNFLYVAVTVVEVLTILAASESVGWFGWCTLYSLAGWILYGADLFLLRRDRRDFVGPNAARLYDDMLRDQRLNLRLWMPGSVAFHLFCWWGARQGWGFALACVQAVCFGLYLADGVLALRRRQGWILQMLVDQREGENVVVRSDDQGMDVGGTG